MMESEFQSLVATLLLPGEKVVWSEQPRPYVFVLRAAHSIFYGLTWVVLGLFWFYGAGGVGKDSVFDGWWRLTPIFSLPFVFAGLSFFLYPAKLYLRAQRTWYVITGQRIMTLEFPIKSQPVVRVFSPEELGILQLSPRWDRLQDLILTRRAQELPHLPPTLDSGFFGLRKGVEALEKLRLLEVEKV